MKLRSGRMITPSPAIRNPVVEMIQRLRPYYEALQNSNLETFDENREAFNAELMEEFNAYLEEMGIGTMYGTIKLQVTLFDLKLYEKDGQFYYYFMRFLDRIREACYM